MKCPNCKTEMEKGYLAPSGEISVIWLSEEDKVAGIFPKAKDLFAYRCPKCGKVELVAGTDKDKGKQ